MPLFKDRFGISTPGRRHQSSGRHPFPLLDQAPLFTASRRVPNSTDRSPSLTLSFSQVTISNTFGLPKTREMPRSLKSSAVDSETHDSSSLSASAGPSCARPTKARKEDPPQTRMTETTVVKTPRGERAKITLSIRSVDSDRNCLVSRSPNRVIKGAFKIPMYQHFFWAVLYQCHSPSPSQGYS